MSGVASWVRRATKNLLLAAPFLSVKAMRVHPDAAWAKAAFVTSLLAFMGMWAYVLRTRGHRFHELAREEQELRLRDRTGHRALADVLVGFTLLVFLLWALVF